MQATIHYIDRLLLPVAAAGEGGGITDCSAMKEAVSGAAYYAHSFSSGKKRCAPLRESDRDCGFRLPILRSDIFSLSWNSIPYAQQWEN